MPFYYPLTLGVRRPKPVDVPAGERSPPWSYETWREGVERYEHVYEEYPEVRVLEIIRRRAPTLHGRFWLILGEPGAGKTTLLETWFTRWVTQLYALRLGMVVPVLIRLRYFQAHEASSDSDTLADQLWRLGLNEKALLKGQGDQIYRQDRERWFHPMWLLDGLDEVTPPPDERLYQALINLPGAKVLTCRSAPYEALRLEADRYKDREYELLGLKPPDQKTFLSHALGGDTHCAEALHQHIQRNLQLRLLAGNPLMLSLIAQVSDRLALPATRAEFYQAAVSEMWNRKLAHHLQARFRTGQRDRVLTDLAQRMGMAQIEAPLAWLEEAASRVVGAGSESLIASLIQAGVVRLHRWDTIDFAHLTFQEFYLARGLRARGLRQALADYWDDARYDETLGLLIATVFQERQYSDIDHGLQWLVEWGEEIHRRTPYILWRKRRSPLHVALHLLHRAGVLLKHLPETEGWLWEKISRSAWRKDVRAHDSKMPPDVLSTLAQDTDWEVRGGVARHPSTPADALARLAEDTDRVVCYAAARHPSLPADLLTQLAQDAEQNVRAEVACNSSISPEVLARLTQDADWIVREGVAWNPNTPPEVLTRLTQDLHPRVRERAADNPNTPPDHLARLAQEGDPELRRGIARNLNNPPELLARLAQDPDPGVRGDVARNVNTSPKALALLAQDANPMVRDGAICHPSTPLEVLARLVQEGNQDAAHNPSSLLEDL